MEAPIDIKIFLPHRPPMLMVDMISHIDDERVDTYFELKPDNIFISNGTLCEAGLIENAAQTCSAIVAKDYFVDENNESRDGVKVIGFISALKSMRILALPEVGTTITTRAALMSKFQTEEYTLCTMSCRTFSGETLLIEGEINLIIREVAAEAEPENGISI
ncbi:MAG: ABC transporter permease [Flavobacterium sp.]|nr:MAG: ABC transporter permease [Flavobacterium sp.]